MSCADAKVTMLICSDRAWKSYLRDTAADSPVRLVLTACELDLQSREDERVLSFRTASAGRGRRRPAGRRPGPGSRPAGRPGLRHRRHGADQLHLGHQRHPQGRHEPPRQHHRTTPSGSAPATPCPRAPSYFALAPLFHITGMVASSPPVSPTRAPWSSPTASRPSVVLEAFAEHRPAYTVGPPRPSWRSPPTPASARATSPPSR